MNHHLTRIISISLIAAFLCQPTAKTGGDEVIHNCRAPLRVPYKGCCVGDYEECYVEDKSLRPVAVGERGAEEVCFTEAQPGGVSWASRVKTVLTQNIPSSKILFTALCVVPPLILTWHIYVWILIFSGYSYQSNPPPEWAFPASWIKKAGLLVYTMPIVLSEEILFRKWCYDWFKRNVSPRLANVAQAALFTATHYIYLVRPEIFDVHTDPMVAPYIFFVGWTLGCIYKRAGVSGSFFSHMALNTVMFSIFWWGPTGFAVSVGSILTATLLTWPKTDRPQTPQPPKAPVEIKTVLKKTWSQRVAPVFSGVVSRLGTLAGHRATLSQV